MPSDNATVIDSTTSIKSTPTSQGDRSTTVLVESQASEYIVDGHTATANAHDVITVVRDPNHPVGKRFELKEDGSIVKNSNVKLSFGIAIQHQVSTATQLKELLENAGKDCNTAIINSYFPSIPIGEEFAILSSGEMAERRDINVNDKQKLIGVHTVEHDDKRLKAVCRLKENMRPSSWVLLDRDVDDQTPEEFSKLSQDEFLAKLDQLLPGIKGMTMVTSLSSSSRVMKDGLQIFNGNGHMFVRVANPDDVGRARSNIIPRAIELGLAWSKPKYSRTNPKEIVAHSWATIIDQSVWDHSRLIFCGKPTVNGNLEVLPTSINVRTGIKGVLDTTQVVVSDVENVRQISRSAGSELGCTGSNGMITIKSNDLHLGTELDTQVHGTITVYDLLAKIDADNVRCQAPFRESSSWAAFLKVSKDGIPFVYDNGTNITHWLVQSDQAEVKAIQAGKAVDQLVVDVKIDSAAVLEPKAIDALAQIQKTDPADYQRKRAQLKDANSKVSLTTIDRMVKANVTDDDMPNTHHGYAKDLIKKLTHEKWPPVSHNGALHVVESTTGLWLPKSIDRLQRTVAEAYDGQENCRRGPEYKAIANHAISLADGQGFFDEAPSGIACPGGFYRIDAGKIIIEPLSPDHRQRYRIDVDPADEPTPLFDKFLHETFTSPNEGEEGQQRDLIQEVAGAIMLGLMPQFQKAILFYDPFGRAGKGTVERILRKLVPNHYVTAVSPFSWDSDYHVASLASSRLNVVGELPDDKSIPAAIFKSALGGDLLTGRHPAGRPFTFKNEAAHLFMSNHFINTRDYSEAFFARWILVEFPNSRSHSKLSTDPGLADKIINAEMSGIAYWALQGGRRLLVNGKFSEPIPHGRLMAEWRRCGNSLDEFIDACCKLASEVKVRRATFYSAYVDWCRGAGRKPFAKGKVKDLLVHNSLHGITLHRPNGNETFNGVEVIDEGFEPLVG